MARQLRRPARGLASQVGIRCTGDVKRIGAVLVIAALLVLPGCSSRHPTTPPPATTAEPSPTEVATSTPTPSATTTGSPASFVEFSVDGAGPYLLGASLAQLQAGGIVAEVTAGPCPDGTTAQATGTWQGIELRFHKDGTLYLEINKSPTIPTPSGAWLGSTLTQLKKIYAAIPGQDLSHGGGSAYLVTTLSGGGILFDLDSTRRVSAMTAGNAGFLKASYLGGTNYC
jgi:hypothetical protein